MPRSDFKAGFRIAGVVLTTVGIGVMVIYCLGGFGTASAGDVIWEKTLAQEAKSAHGYDVVMGSGGSSPSNVTINRVWIKGSSECDGAIKFDLSWDADFFTPNYDGDEAKRSCFVDSTVTDSGAVIGNCSHGYIYSGDLQTVCYVFLFTDLNLSGLNDNDYFVVATPLPGDWVFCDPEGLSYFSVVSNVYDALDYGDVVFASGSNLIAYDSYYGRGDPNHRYVVTEWDRFRNELCIEELVPGCGYRLTIQRENIENWDYGIASRYVIYDGTYTYFNQSDLKIVNESSVLMPTICDWLWIECYGSGFTSKFNVTDICEVPEPGYFDLSGYTRSIQGNLIPGVLLTAQGNTEYSNNISFYEFENLETGSFDLAWNKTGYHNDSVSRYMGTPGDYQIDVYLIPLDALDTGEFGGRVYDFCTLESIQGAYVYLFNETADSGKYAYTNKYGFYRFAGMTEGMDYEVSASKDGYDASIVHSFTFNESNINETHCKTRNIWLLPEGGCPEDGGIPTPPPAPTPTPHEWTNEEIVSQLRITVPSLFFIVLLVTFMWFLRKAGGAKR